MVLPAPTSTGAGVKVRIAGIPVRFDPWFFIIGALFSFRGGLAVVVVWLTVLGGSVLVHELGHAFLARTTGARPEIVIHALGGLTSWLPPGEVSRGRRIAISLAGPAAGMVFGLLFVLADRAGMGEDGGLAALAISLGIHVNILYGLFNLLPILPLDGGQTLRDLLPGSEPSRERVAAVVSIIVGIVAIGAALLYDQPFAAVFLALFVFGNFPAATGGRALSRRAVRPDSLAPARQLHAEGNFGAAADYAHAVAAGADRRGDHLTAVAAVQLAATALLDAGRPIEARQALLDLPAGSVDLVLEGRVLIATGQQALGLQRLAAGFAAAPDDRAAYHLARLLTESGAHEQLVALVGGAGVPTAAALAAARGALDVGAADVAGRIAEAAGSRSEGAERSQAAFVAARAWARAGNSSRSMLALRAAVSADRRYAAAAAGESDLRSLHGAEFDELLRSPS